MNIVELAKLKKMIGGGEGGGLEGLVPVDGTISIMNTPEGGKSIAVAISPDAGNQLVAVKNGLFVPTTVVPDYSIEQVESEEGFFASYRLKKTVGEEITYVGDTINIAKDLVLQAATLETVIEDGVPYPEAKIGDPYIKMVFNSTEASNLYIPVKGLVDIYTAGAGIEIINNKISVKIAETANGLVAVDGALSINLATRETAGAMSAKDKMIIDSLPSAYVARKYDITDVPVGTLVDYHDHEIRIMCPKNVKFTQQQVGEGGDANSYYMTFKTYVPNENIVGYIEYLGNQPDEEILTSFSTDEFGRKYQSTWLPIAKYDETTSTWLYYGADSTSEKYIGWDYRIDWYDANGVVIASDKVRINLSNEECHNTNKPYYLVDYATVQEVAEIKEITSVVEEVYTWGEI